MLDRINAEFAPLLKKALEQAVTGAEQIDAVFQTYNMVNHRTEFQGIRIFLNFHVGLSREKEPVLYKKVEAGIQGTDAVWHNVIQTGQADGTIRSDIPVDKLVNMVVAAWFGHHVIREEDTMGESSLQLQESIRYLLTKTATTSGNGP